MDIRVGESSEMRKSLRTEELIMIHQLRAFGKMHSRDFPMEISLPRIPLHLVLFAHLIRTKQNSSDDGGEDLEGQFEGSRRD